jgi:hypothetical protein
MNARDPTWSTSQFRGADTGRDNDHFRRRAKPGGRESLAGGDLLRLAWLTRPYDESVAAQWAISLGG